MEICKKNWSKVRALYALRLRKLAGDEWAGAGEISGLTGVSRRSLYVLLGRWRGWRLVKCNKFTTPYKYALACHGSHYLAQLPAWYGPRSLAYEVVCDNSRPSFYWASVDRPTGQVTALHFLSYPFKTAADYSLLKPNAAGRFVYTGDSLIRIKKPKAIEAIRGVRDDLGLSCGDELIDFMVSRELVVRRRQP